MRPTFHWVKPRDAVLLVVTACGLLIIASSVLLHFITPAPPAKIVMASGVEAGAYHQFAEAYRQVLARSRVKLEVRLSEGSVENLALISNERSGVGLALLQGGIASNKTAPGLVSLGRLFYEPLWIFYRGDKTIEQLTQLAGKRIAVGPEASGTYRFAKDLLAANSITPDNTVFVSLTGEPAERALHNGEVDALMLVMGAEAPLVQRLLRNPTARLVSLKQAEAYTRLFPFLAKLTLPAGAVDLVRSLPPDDVNLLASSAVLVARDNLHPDIMNLLAQACSEVHGGSGLFHQAGHFPRQVDPEFPVSESATRYYKNGSPFLQRYLPFWLAIFLERALLIGIPIFTVAFPLFKILPWLYKWRAHERLLHWYAKLKDIEIRLETRPTAGQLDMLLTSIDDIDCDVRRASIPLSLSEQFYNLRGHIDFVRHRASSLAAAVTPGSDEGNVLPLQLQARP